MVNSTFGFALGQLFQLNHDGLLGHIVPLNASQLKNQQKQGIILFDLSLHFHHTTVSTIQKHNEELVHSSLKIQWFYLYGKEHFEPLRIDNFDLLQDQDYCIYQQQPEHLAIILSISSPAAAIGNNPTAVRTEYLPPTSSGMTNVS